MHVADPDLIPRTSKSSRSYRLSTPIKHKEGKSLKYFWDARAVGWWRLGLRAAREGAEVLHPVHHQGKEAAWARTASLLPRIALSVRRKNTRRMLGGRAAVFEVVVRV